MLREALEFLTQLAPETNRAAVIERDHYDLIRHADGTVTTRERPRPPRRDEVFTLESLVDQLANLPGEHTVWVSPSDIVAVIEDDPRNGYVKMFLNPSREHLTLTNIDRATLAQADFVRRLLIDLAVPPEAVAPFRYLTWRSGTNAAGKTLAGAESLGREVYAELTNAKDVPEEITLTLPLYENIGQRDAYSIRCRIDVDTASERLTLCMMPGELERATWAHAEGNVCKLRELLATTPPFANVMLGRGDTATK